MSEWYERAYDGAAPPDNQPPLPRPLYPPDANTQGKQPSSDGPDVVAYKRALCRAGRWGTWDPSKWDDSYSNAIAHGKGPNVKDTGLAGFQRQMGIDDTGWLGEKTYSAMAYALISDPASPHYGEHIFDGECIRLLQSAHDRYDGNAPSDTRHRLSDHFVVEEFDCNDGTPVASREYNGLEALCAVFLEPLRGKYGDVHINSGFRTPAYNASVGGASNSFHIYPQHNGNDQASDVTCASGTPEQWHSFLNNIRQNKRGGNGGLGLYSTFVHVDMRDYPSSWYG